ncbi:MAG: DUF2254 domain-containing protein [Ilumatobacteraceae bacterium]
MIRRYRLLQAVGSSLWLVPLLCVFAGVGLAIATLAIDRRYPDLVPRRLTGGPSAAQTILSTIATATVTLGSLVLTITTVAVQLAMGQFSPRIVQALLTDRRSQLAIGLFGATFVYALMALPEVDDQGDGIVPGISIVVAMGLMLFSIAGLFFFVHHAGRSLRASGLIDLAGDNSRRQLDRVYPQAPAGPSPGEDDGREIAAPEPGVVVDVATARLVRLARRADCVLELVPAMGDFVPAGAPLFRVLGGDPGKLDRTGVAGMVALGAERTHRRDPAYGLRELVDIAVRSVAEPFQDPTTCVQAIDRLHDGLRQLAPRPFPSGQHRDEHGKLRLVTRAISWDGYVRLAFDEIRLAGATSPQVTRRLVAAIEDLQTVVLPERKAALDRQHHLLAAAVRRHYDDEADAVAALTADAQGIGSGSDVASRDDDAPAGLPDTPTPRR